MDGRLQDLIYETVVQPALWPELLLALCDHTGALACQLSHQEGDAAPVVLAEGSRSPAPVLPDGLVVPLPSGDRAVIGFDDPEALGRLGRLRGHLARALRIAAHLRLDRAAQAADLFRVLGLPAVVVSQSGRVILPGDMFFRTEPGCRLVLADRAAQARLLRALDTGRPGCAALRVGDDPSHLLHLLPRRAEGILGQGDLLVVATRVDPLATAPVPDILIALFDLTIAEARLASALAAGLSLREAAAQCGLQFGSARTYLERVFRKTGTHGQGQLIAMLKSAQPFRVVP